ncbi:toll/interleukin-1 receptor domain-containing protein [Sorangium sp. So ce1335]|uniref:toll/interleukin-1 receptor domain-containing protein n=1 Tax=Sorangium sp. So ce1335 TaxID=3133335 RepID=UPI003F62D9A3
MTDVPSLPPSADSTSPERADATPGEAGQHAFDAFISYSWDDKPIARALYQRLVDAGLRVWIDDQQIPIGANITAAIERGLESSRHLIVLVSRPSLGSGWATVERHVALFSDPDARHGVILPILLEDIDPLPPALRIRRWVRLHGEEGLDALVPELLAAIRGQPSAPAPAAAVTKPSPKATAASPQPAPEPRSKRALLWTARALAATSALAPLAHSIHPDPITRQCASLAAPAVLAATIGIELTFHHYRLAVAELAALTLVLVYAARMPEPPSPPKPASELSSSSAPLVPSRPDGGGPAAGTRLAAAARGAGAPDPPPTPGPAPSRAKGTGASAAAAHAGGSVDPATLATSGAASCRGQSCTLDLAGRSLPTSTTRACLAPASPQPELAGHQATCRIDGAGPGCIRDDRVATVPLKAPIRWSLCSP